MAGYNNPKEWGGQEEALEEDAVVVSDDTCGKCKQHSFEGRIHRCAAFPEGIPTVKLQGGDPRAVTCGRNISREPV